MKKINEDKLLKASGSEKIQAFFNDLIVKESFNKKIAALRQKYNINPKFYLQALDQSNQFKYELEIPPSSWSKKIDRETWAAFLRDLERIQGDYGLLPTNFLNPLTLYIFFEASYIRFDFPSWQLCFIQDLNAVECPKNRTKYLKQCPIALRISPYASERDILDYIKASYETLIQPLQKKFKKNKHGIGSSKTKDLFIQQRNDFIYQNLHLPRKELRALVKQWCISRGRDWLDPGSLNKTISLERRRRKDL